ncbi:MAG TPA: hypothetical protein VGO11_11465 [Chthoniobacteraceae bacterium]|nr:hypothetical protein [Chthoniobacteraceae bacterium]
MNCPHCHRLLYSRRWKDCGFCGKELPPECRFSEDEIEEMDRERELLEKRRAAFKAKEEEEKKRQGDGGGDIGPTMMF